MNKGKQQLVGQAVFFIYIFAISNTISNAAVSISFVLLLLYTIFICREKHTGVPAIGKGLYMPWLIFITTLVAASLLLGDSVSTKIALDYIYLSFPFLLTLTFYTIQGNQSMFVLPIIFSMVLIGGKSLYVFLFINKLSSMRVITFDPYLNGFGTLIAVSLPFLGMLAQKNYEIDKKIAGITFFGFIIGVISLILTGSRGAIFSFVLSSVLTVILKMFLDKSKRSIRKLGITIIAGIIIIGAFAIFQGGVHRTYDSQRILFGKSSYAMWQDNKLCGVGLNNWEKAYYEKYKLPEAYEKNITMPHNTVAYFFSTTGIIGGIGFLIFSFGIIIYLCRKMLQQPGNYLIQAMLWSFLAISAQGLVDAGITIRIVFRLFSAYMGVTIASISMYKQYAQSN